MPQVETHQAAREAALKAHNSHFGQRNTKFFVQDGDSAGAIIAELGNDQTPVTYTVEFALHSPPPAFSTQTSLKFTVLLPLGFPGDFKPPAQSTAHDCPLNKNPKLEMFHYKGLFMVDGEPLNISDDFGHSMPPGTVQMANQRLKDAKPEDKKQKYEDRENVRKFIKYHYWLNEGGKR